MTDWYIFEKRNNPNNSVFEIVSIFLIVPVEPILNHPFYLKRYSWTIMNFSSVARRSER